jgi:DNA-binding transcriptional LysR family regulator
MFCDQASVAPLIGLRQRFPRLELHVTSQWSQVLFEEVRAGRIDAAIGVWPSGQGSPGGLNARLFGKDRLAIVAAVDDPIPARTSLAALGARAWIINPDGCGFRAALRSSLTKAGMPLDVAIETPRMDLQLELVSHGLGIGLVPQWGLKRSPRRGALRSLSVKGIDLDIRYMVADGGVAGNMTPVLDFLAESFAAAMALEDRRRRRGKAAR